MAVAEADAPGFVDVVVGGVFVDEVATVVEKARGDYLTAAWEMPKTSLAPIFNIRPAANDPR